jgi:hypothetical protein
LKEISRVHKLLVDHIDHIDRTNNENDPLRVILKDLGPVPNILESNKKDIQLPLQGRFDGIADQSGDREAIYATTKAAIISIFKGIPIDKTRPTTLTGILEYAKQYSNEQEDSKKKEKLQKNIDKVLNNIEQLEKQGHPKVSSEDKYTALLRDVAIQVSNRKEIRESQKKEILRLDAALKNLKNHHVFMEEQMEEFNKYLAVCRENSAKRTKGDKDKPVKFPYKELVKKNVIYDSVVPTISRSKCKFFISMPEIGRFFIECKIQGLRVGTMEVELEDMLEKRDNNVLLLDSEKVTLHIPSTILLINQYFLR